MITLTQEQAVDLTRGEETPTRVVDPQTRQTWVLISEADYVRYQEMLDDEADQAAIRKVGRRNAARRLQDDLTA